MDNFLVVYAVDFPQLIRAPSDGVSSLHEPTIGAAVELG